MRDASRQNAQTFQFLHLLHALFEFPVFSDVARHVRGADNGSVGIDDGRYRQRNSDPVAVFAHTDGFEVPDGLARLDGAKNPRFFVGPVRGHQEAHRTPGHFLARITVQSFRAGVPAFDDAAEAFSDDGVLGRFDDRRETHHFDVIQLVLRRLFHDPDGNPGPSFHVSRHSQSAVERPENFGGNTIGINTEMRRAIFICRGGLVRRNRQEPGGSGAGQLRRRSNISLIQMLGDEFGVRKNLRIFDSDLKRELDLLIRRFIVSIGRQSPGIAIEREDVPAARDLAFGDIESLPRLMRVIGIVSNQFMVGIVGDIGFGQRFPLEFGEVLLRFLRAAARSSASASA